MSDHHSHPVDRICFCNKSISHYINYLRIFEFIASSQSRIHESPGNGDCSAESADDEYETEEGMSQKGIMYTVVEVVLQIGVVHIHLRLSVVIFMHFVTVRMQQLCYSVTIQLGQKLTLTSKQSSAFAWMGTQKLFLRKPRQADVCPRTLHQKGTQV